MDKYTVSIQGSRNVAVTLEKEKNIFGKNDKTSLNASQLKQFDTIKGSIPEYKTVSDLRQLIFDARGDTLKVSDTISSWYENPPASMPEWETQTSKKIKKNEVGRSAGGLGSRVGGGAGASHRGRVGRGKGSSSSGRRNERSDGKLKSSDKVVSKQSTPPKSKPANPIILRSESADNNKQTNSSTKPTKNAWSTTPSIVSKGRGETIIPKTKTVKTLAESIPQGKHESNATTTNNNNNATATSTTTRQSVNKAIDTSYIVNTPTINVSSKDVSTPVETSSTSPLAVSGGGNAWSSNSSLARKLQKPVTPVKLSSVDISDNKKPVAAMILPEQIESETIDMAEKDEVVHVEGNTQNGDIKESKGSISDGVSDLRSSKRNKKSKGKKVKSETHKPTSDIDLSSITDVINTLESSPVLAPEFATSVFSLSPDVNLGKFGGANVATDFFFGGNFASEPSSADVVAPEDIEEPVVHTAPASITSTVVSSFVDESKELNTISEPVMIASPIKERMLSVESKLDAVMSASNMAGTTLTIPPPGLHSMRSAEDIEREMLAAADRSSTTKIEESSSSAVVVDPIESTSTSSNMYEYGMYNSSSAYSDVTNRLPATSTTSVTSDTAPMYSTMYNPPPAVGAPHGSSDSQAGASYPPGMDPLAYQHQFAAYSHQSYTLPNVVPHNPASSMNSNNNNIDNVSSSRSLVAGSTTTDSTGYPVSNNPNVYHPSQMHYPMNYGHHYTPYNYGYHGYHGYSPRNIPQYPTGSGRGGMPHDTTPNNFYNTHGMPGTMPGTMYPSHEPLSGTYTNPGFEGRDKNNRNGQRNNRGSKPSDSDPSSIPNHHHVYPNHNDQYGAHGSATGIPTSTSIGSIGTPTSEAVHPGQYNWNGAYGNGSYGVPSWHMPPGFTPPSNISSSGSGSGQSNHPPYIASSTSVSHWSTNPKP